MTEGIVLEAYQNSNGFNSMTMIVKQGVLKTGALILVGDEYSRIKHMHDDMGVPLGEAHPGDAVQIVGIPSIPAAGDFIYEVESEEKARFIAARKRQIATNEVKESQMKNGIKTAKIKMTWKERRNMYGSAGTENWIIKFNKQEEMLN